MKRLGKMVIAAALGTVMMGVAAGGAWAKASPTIHLQGKTIGSEQVMLDSACESRWHITGTGDMKTNKGPASYWVDVCAVLNPIPKRGPLTLSVRGDFETLVAGGVVRGSVTGTATETFVNYQTGLKFNVDIAIYTGGGPLTGAHGTLHWKGTGTAAGATSFTEKGTIDGILKTR